MIGSVTGTRRKHRPGPGGIGYGKRNVTRMCLALLRLDFAEAWSWNPGLMLLLPFLAVLGLRAAVRYVRTGRAGPTRGEQIVIGLMVAFLVVYGVVRNLPGFAWLAPGQTPPELFPLLRALP